MKYFVDEWEVEGSSRGWVQNVRRKDGVYRGLVFVRQCMAPEQGAVLGTCGWRGMAGS